jgi:hypothetical protein
MKTPINKILYVAFLILGIYQAYINKDFAQAAASFGIGLVFDPFNPNQILHLAIAATLLGFGIGLNDK